MIAADDDDDWCLIRLVLMDKMLWKGFWKVSNVKSSDAVDVDDSNKTKKVLNWSWRHLSVAEGGVPVNNLYLKSAAVAVIFWSWFVRQHVIQKQLQPWNIFLWKQGALWPHHLLTQAPNYHPSLWSWTLMVITSSTLNWEMDSEASIWLVSASEDGVIYSILSVGPTSSSHLLPFPVKWPPSQRG